MKEPCEFIPAHKKFSMYTPRGDRDFHKTLSLPSCTFKYGTVSQYFLFYFMFINRLLGMEEAHGERILKCGMLALLAG